MPDKQGISGKSQAKILIKVITKRHVSLKTLYTMQYTIVFITIIIQTYCIFYYIHGNMH